MTQPSVDNSNNIYNHVLQQARSKITEELELSDKILQEISQSGPGQLKDRLSSIVQRKGKRVRATLLFLIAGTGTSEPPMLRTANAAVSIELLHLASLIHDDVIDASELRRGVESAHMQWGNQMAVLLGDYVFSKALELVVTDDDKRIPIKICDSSSKLITGEMLELDQQGNKSLTQDEYMEIIYGKTASLIESCTEVGAMLAGHPEYLIDKCRIIGKNFGMAFQVVDDLLDFGLGADDLGKTTYEDIANDVMTLPVILFSSRASDSEKEHFHKLCENAMNPENQKEIFNTLMNSGAFAECHKIAMEYVDEALEALDCLPESANKTMLIEMCQSMTARAN